MYQGLVFIFNAILIIIEFLTEKKCRIFVLLLNSIFILSEVLIKKTFYMLKIEIALIFLFTIYMCRYFSYWKNRGVVFETPVPLFGNVLEFYKPWKISPGNIIKNLYDKYSNYPYVGFFLYDEPCLLLRDREIIKRILTRDFKFFTDKFMQSCEQDSLSNKSLPFLPHDEWKELRTILASAFTPKKLKENFYHLKKVSAILDDHLSEFKKTNPGEAIDIKEVIAKYETDITGLTQFSVMLNCLTEPDSEFRLYGKILFGNFINVRCRELMAVYMMPRWLKNLFGYRFIEKPSGEYFKKKFLDIIRIKKLRKENNESNGNIQKDFLDILIEYHEKNSSFSLNDIISQAIVFFTAGFDTTSTVTSFALFELARNSSVQNKLRKKLKDALEETGGQITYELINSLSFLEDIVLETLRLHPTVPTIDRIAVQDYLIEETNLLIKKGTPIFISVTGLHCDENNFNNPKIFDPENFGKSDASKNSAYMSFGIGVRSCIAKQWGMIQVKYSLAHIISNYEINLSNNTSVEIDPHVYFTSGKKGLFVHLDKIKHLIED
ncbi:hypothetical protein HCN44_001148 [Aphidius gifuensis]|uniref:Cytochrome P450 n=1 Tax=Aphidius gifuensis TaxID=684658 RepID=A0A834XKH0_APHGI|nr:cytochrome P450 6k1-like [Aphidius gifuensis]KAF7988575.1 hypothetical protein HCN44_001148 [Aphidius gifuensis]